MSKPDEKNVVVVMPREIATAFKAHCAQKAVTMKSILERSILDCLAESAAPQRDPKRQKAEA